MREYNHGTRPSATGMGSGSVRAYVRGLDLGACAVVVAAALTRSVALGFAALAVWLLVGAHLDARRAVMLRFGIWILIGSLLLVWWAIEGGLIGDTRGERLMLGGSLLVGVVGHLTGRRALERQVTAHEEAIEIQRDNEFMARTTRSVAHDLRNVFTVVNSCAVDLYDEMHGRRAGVLVLEILNAAERGLGVTTELMVAGHGTPPDDRRADLRLLVCELEPLLRRLATSSVQVDVACANASVYARIDRTSIMQILMNLVDNAAEAMGRSGNVLVDVQRGVRSAAPGAAAIPVAVLTVRDDGPGMPADVAARIFDVGYSTKTGHHGGLGLAVVASVVSRCHGWISVDSSVGGGTSFRIELPLVERSEKDLALVVMANDRARRLVTDALMSNGFEVLESNDALDACDLVIDRPAPALAVIDEKSAADEGLRHLAHLADVPIVRTVGDGPGMSPFPTTADEAIDLLHHSNRNRTGGPNGGILRPITPPQ
ncbi:MAG: HAMP domain-containing sensor histidine kinase [Actinomycetota bacterium]